ncbi:hypothetical protein CN264_19035 [Bacillus cereus]|uniref:helix-turn-helix domain-containing protein n=1 Tax=Bacillus cereus TaxID=1396 RepID=UPI000BF93526|nr:helix-turn-helix domain-containing protein [Bacillus cereus]PFC23504.1 hypothetical protein CN264_19035 [Bacillus cereus]
MLFALDEVMTASEACERWGISNSSLHMKLSRLKNSGTLNELILAGKVKYYKAEGKIRGEWIITIEAMESLFPKNN